MRAREAPLTGDAKAVWAVLVPPDDEDNDLHEFALLYTQEKVRSIFLEDTADEMDETHAEDTLESE